MSLSRLLVRVWHICIQIKNTFCINVVNYKNTSFDGRENRNNKKKLNNYFKFLT